jgi:heme/copper-type cytochrome/quinol oxidase subunit 4
MKYYYLGFILAIAFGIYSTYLFLKASSLYAQYRDSVKRRTRGELILKSWKFIVPIKAYEGESKKMGRDRKQHATYIKRYYIMMVAIVILLIISSSSAKY